MNKENQFEYEEFKKMVLQYREGVVKKFVYNEKFGPTRESYIISRKIIKEYQPVQKKGIIDEDLNVLPFGYY